MAQQEFLRARRTRRHSGLLLLDVDDFKSINDRYGHAMGDVVIRRIAELMRQHLREVDTPGRFGGDEFGAVLVEVNPPDIRVPAERLRACVEAARFQEAPELRVTVSVGAALYDPVFADVDAWLRAADGALYDAKAAGRKPRRGARGVRADRKRLRQRALNSGRGRLPAIARAQSMMSATRPRAFHEPRAWPTPTKSATNCAR